MSVKPKSRDTKPRTTRLSVFAVIVTGSILLASCGADDSTFSIRVVNDTNKTVIDRQCNITCDQLFDRVVISPGKYTTDTETPDGVPEPDRVISTSGLTLGCLPFKFNQTPSGTLSVNISKMVRCGKNDGTDAVHGLDWPLRDD
jgi:hypothetical protein